MVLEVSVNRNLLNQIMVEEGMDPSRAERIKIRFIRYRQSSTKTKIWIFLLLGGPAAGYWVEDLETATVATDQPKSVTELSKTLAHELGHALDEAKSSYFWPTIGTWLFSLIILVGGTLGIFGLHATGGAFPVLLDYVAKVLIWLGFAVALSFFTWLLIYVLFYRNSPLEKSARSWTERLTSREDWSQVLNLQTGSEERGGS